MKKNLLLLSTFFYLTILTKAQISLVQLNSYVLTPNETDTLGAFARIYYHPSRNKFYLIYSARQAGSAAPKGQLSNFAWREYDAGMNFTGSKSSLPGFTQAGDFAMTMVDSNYYHLTSSGNTTSGILKFKLSKFDDDFTVLGTTTITLTPNDNNIDQMMNYANNRLIIGAMHDTSATPPVTPPSLTYDPSINVYQYDLNLNPLAPYKILSQKAYSWGGSCIYDSGSHDYNFIADKTTSQFNIATLYAYKYDTSLNYISTTQLTANGQWASGVVWDGQYYYVAYHTGAHNHGNLSIGVFTSNWVNVLTDTITNYPVVTTNGQTSQNPNRPYITRVGNKLYISYDVETYIYPANQKDWQAHVKVYQIVNTTGIQEPVFSTYTIYPNPFSSFTTLKTAVPLKNATLTIYNSFGQSVKEIKNISGQIITLSRSNLPSGLYFLRLTDENKTYSAKLVITDK